MKSQNTAQRSAKGIAHFDDDVYTLHDFFPDQRYLICNKAPQPSQYEIVGPPNTNRDEPRPQVSTSSHRRVLWLQPLSNTRREKRVSGSAAAVGIFWGDTLAFMLTQALA